MPKRSPPLPFEPLTRERVLEAIRKAGGKAQKRDIAHELGIGPDQKKELRHILRALEEEGALGRSGRKAYADAQALPESGVMDILDRDPDGELLARMRGPDGYFGPTIRLAPGEARAMRGEAAIGVPASAAAASNPPTAKRATISSSSNNTPAKPRTAISSSPNSCPSAAAHMGRSAASSKR